MALETPNVDYQKHSDNEEGAAEKATASSALSKDEEDIEKHGQPDEKHPHLKRFFCWRLTKKKWIYAVVGLVLLILLVLLLIVFLAIIPAIVQHYVNKVKMSINYVDIKQLSTDPNLNNFDVQFSVQVQYDASVSSTLNNAKAVMYYQDQSFGKLSIGKQKFPKGDQDFPLVLDENVAITDADVFGSLSSAMIKDKEVVVDSHTKVKVHAMGLSFGGIKLNREFTIKSFGNFLDPKPVVNNITLTTCDSSGFEININVTLDNVSQIGIDGVGRLNLSVYNEANYLGQAISVSSNVGFPRGNSSLALNLFIEQNNNTKPALNSMINGLLGGTGLRFDVTGDHPYATTVALLKKAFASLNISMVYTDGLSKVKFSPACNLTTVVAGLA